MRHSITKYMTMGLLGAALAFSSCSDSWLDTVPTGLLVQLLLGK